MQNVLIKDNKVDMILQWLDERKINENDYQDYDIIYLNNNELDISKQYEYINGEFNEIKLELKTNNDISNIERLQKENISLKNQIEVTEKSIAEIMNLISV